MHRRNRAETLTYLMFLVPAITAFTIFFIVPFLKSLYLSFTDAYGYNQTQNFIALDNYREALSNPGFRRAMLVTCKYTVFVTIFTNILSLSLALLLDGNVRCKKLFRAVFFLPNLMSLIIVSFVFVFLYGDVYRSLIELLHIPEKAYISWLGNERLALYSMGIAAVWQCAGYYMLIYIAGLQSIPPDLIEAARIDGASAEDIIFRIKLPMLSPVIIMNTILLITAGFKTFDFPMAMTSGGPAGATTTIALYIYNTGFRSNRTGYATAQSVLLFLIICTITACMYLYQNRREKKDAQ